MLIYNHCVSFALKKSCSYFYKEQPFKMEELIETIDYYYT